MKHMVDLLISLETNCYKYLTNDYDITFCLYYLWDLIQFNYMLEVFLGFL